MTTDPYAALGVQKTASDAEIKKAYRKIVRDSHPDINPDDPDAEERFKKASAAFDLLKDPDTRARFDRGEIDATGAERPERRFYREYAEAPGQGFWQGGFEGFSSQGDTGDFFSVRTVVTPGIRPVDNKPAGDQKRVVTVDTAFSNGADHIVVGRPIRDAESPREAAEGIQTTIEAAVA